MHFTFRQLNWFLDLRVLQVGDQRWYTLLLYAHDFPGGWLLKSDKWLTIEALYIVFLLPWFISYLDFNQTA